MIITFGFVAVWNSDGLTRAWCWAKEHDAAPLYLLDAALAGQVELGVLKPPRTRSLEALGSGDLLLLALPNDWLGAGPEAWPRTTTVLRWVVARLMLDGDHTPDRHHYAVEQAPIVNTAKAMAAWRRPGAGREH